MEALHAADPRFGFDRHKGYATSDHLDGRRAFWLLDRAPALVQAADPL